MYLQRSFPVSFNLYFTASAISLLLGFKSDGGACCLGASFSFRTFLMISRAYEGLNFSLCFGFTWYSLPMAPPYLGIMMMKFYIQIKIPKIEQINDNFALQITQAKVFLKLKKFYQQNQNLINIPKRKKTSFDQLAFVMLIMLRNIQAKLIVMSFLKSLFEWLPNPFRSLRRHLNIEQQWFEFKQHMRPHRYKIYLGILVASYPLYESYAKQLLLFLKDQAEGVVSDLLKVQRAPFQLTDNFVRNLVGSILNDAVIKKQGLEFVNSIITQNQFVEDILNLLVSALQDPHFMEGLQGSSKQLVKTIIVNPEVQDKIGEALANIGTDQRIKDSLVSLTESALADQRAQRALQDLLKKTFEDEGVKQALAGAVNYSVQELLKDEELMKECKIFIFFLLRKFESDDQVKSMMDLLFAKGLGLTKKKKESELRNILRNIDSKRNRSEEIS